MNLCEKLRQNRWGASLSCEFMCRSINADRLFKKKAMVAIKATDWEDFHQRVEKK